MTRVIDVHHHFIPDEYRAALIASGNSHPDGMPAIPEWSEALALDYLDSASVDQAFLSISTPGVLLDGVSPVDLARQVNDAAASIVERNPGRFGAFATLPLPHVDASIAEIGHSLDDLHLDGVTLLTHFNGIYLGDRRFDPVFEALDALSATVFLHPTSPVCCETTSLGYPRPFLEFMFDTTRAVTNLIYSGTLDDFPAITWIVPHAGAALPALSARIAQIQHVAPASVHASKNLEHYLSRMYYDLAGPRSDDGIRSLLQIAATTQLLFGSDWPFTPAPRAIGGIDAILQSEVLTENDTRQVLHENAARLLPRASK